MGLFILAIVLLALTITVIALVREVRLRRALQALFRRFLTRRRS